MLVTRTKEGIKVTARVANTKTEKFETVEVTINKVDAKKIEKETRKALEGSDYALLSIVKFEESNKLYGLDEKIFLQYAVELDPKTRKPIAKAEEATEATEKAEA